MAVGSMQEAAKEVKQLVADIESKNIRLGVAIEKIRSAYYYGDLIAFLKNEKTEYGEMYFVKLKPLYDEYGYEKVNKVLLELDKEEKTNE